MQLHYPADPLQPGPIYFKTGRKCGLFGICNEATGEQSTYAIDEAVAVSKGSNAVVSYLHDYLENAQVQHTGKLILHADNCT